MVRVRVRVCTFTIVLSLVLVFVLTTVRTTVFGGGGLLVWAGVVVVAGVLETVVVTGLFAVALSVAGVVDVVVVLAVDFFDELLLWALPRAAVVIRPSPEPPLVTWPPEPCADRRRRVAERMRGPARDPRSILLRDATRATAGRRVRKLGAHAAT